MTLLVNDLTTLPEGSILILDDYHLLQGQPVHEAMSFLFDHLPAPVHVVIATREDPPLPLARMRARRQITELRATDLRFTPDEAATFLNAMMGLDLAAADVQALEARTEGWIAGLQLAALSIRGRNDAGGFIAAFTGSHHFVLDYLAEEVFNRQPTAVQRFLLRTCLLPRLCGPLCDAVTGQTESQAMLQQVERANLFLVPLDEERRWYRYHHLFAELLQVRLRETHPGLDRELYGRASRWFAQEGLVVEAIQQALAGEDYTQAQHLIAQHAEPLWRQGHMAHLRHWLAALPPAALHASPRLLAIQAWTWFLLSGTSLAGTDELLDEAAAILARRPAPAEPVGDAAGDPTGQQVPLPGMIAVIRAALASMRGDVTRTVALSEEAFAALPATSTYWRSIAALNLGFAHAIGGDMVPAAQMLAQAVQLCQEAGNIYAALVGMTNLAKVYWSLGQLQRAADQFAQALDLLGRQGGWLLPYSVTIHVGLALVLYEWNDLDEAAAHIQQGLDHAQPPQQALAILEGYIALARIRQAHGDAPGARAAMARSAAVVPATGLPWTARLVAAYTAHLWLRQGDIDQASRWMEDTPPAPDREDRESRNAQLPEREGLTRARVLLAQGRPAAALALLEPLAQSVAQAQNTRLVLETRVLQALAWQALGDLEQALALRDRALALAAPEGYLRRFLDEGPPMAALLHREPRPAGIAAYLGRLLAAFAADPATAPSTPPAAAARTGAAASLVEPLNEREREVLRLLAAGLSNRQIATQLVVALSTVKWYINNLYSKLGVSSRTQALARARDWDLL
jgi:LuxR family maltose regulon positive regulatory protein